MLLFLPRVTISTVMQLTEELLTTFGNYIVLGIVVYILLNLFFYVVIIRSGNVYYIKNVKKALIVTAHPDDESMFFGPVILKLVSDKCRVYLLCLSPGNYNNKGWQSKDELWSSCEVLGIPSSNILLIKNDNIDDPKLKVTIESVAHTILSYVEQYEIDTIITFDKDGVSGHKNHVALFYSISFLCVRAVLPQYCKVYTLESVGFFRKYVGFMDSMYSYMNSEYIYFNSIPESKKLAVAMAAHNSQFVWHNRVYINISRYMFINSFTEMHIFGIPAQ